MVLSQKKPQKQPQNQHKTKRHLKNFPYFKIKFQVENSILLILELRSLKEKE